jgi:predicted nucleic acid-binding protein
MENYGKGWSNIAPFLASPLHYKGLTVYAMNLGSRIRASSHMKDYGLDFDDALAVQALKDLSADTIVSYDEDFDSVGWVKRRIPEEP